MKKPLFAAIFALLASAALVAQEGVATYKMTMHVADTDMPGTMKMTFSPAGWRTDMHTDMSAMAGDRPERSAMAGVHDTTMLGKASDPQKAYMVHESTRTYSVIHTENTAPRNSEEKWTVQRTGRGSAGGMSCDGATITSSEGSKVNVCVASDFPISTAWWTAMKRRQSEGWFQAMNEAGLKGFPVKMSMLKNGKPEIEMELVKLDRRSVPDSTFEIPAGYTEAKGGMGRMSPEQQKMMQDQLSKMTPEQRKAYEDAMKRSQQPQ